MGFTLQSRFRGSLAFLISLLCDAIFVALKDEYRNIPSAENEAFNGQHIDTCKRAFFGIVLMAIADYDYKCNEKRRAAPILTQAVT